MQIIHCLRPIKFVLFFILVRLTKFASFLYLDNDPHFLLISSIYFNSFLIPSTKFIFSFHNYYFLKNNSYIFPAFQRRHNRIVCIGLHDELSDNYYYDYLNSALTTFIYICVGNVHEKGKVFIVNNWRRVVQDLTSVLFS